MHFGLLFATITGLSFNIFKSSVVKYYVFAILAGIILVAANLYINGYYSLFNSIRFSAFQVISVGTSTGFATVDSGHWSGFAHMILIFFTLQCACAGSTSGGIKVDRIVIFLKSIRNQVLMLRHPRGVFTVKIDNNIIENDIIRNALVFIVLYILIVFLSSLVLAAFGVDGITALSASAATMGNVGPGFGEVSSLANFSSIPHAGKWVLTANMLLGRLEIYGIISLFMLKTWR